MRKVLCGLVAVIWIIALAGCQRAPAPDIPVPDWEPEPPQMQDLTSLLTAAEVSEAVGVTVGDGVMQDNGEVLSFVSEDYTVQVSLLLEEPAVGAAAYLDVVAAQYEADSLVPAPNLGEAAYWCAASGELFVQEGSHVLSVNVVADAIDAERRLIAARQLAALVLERI